MRRAAVSGQWSRHGAASIAVRAGIALGPALIALAVSWSIGRLFPPGPSGGARALWIVATVAVALAAAMVATRLLRRLAPLAWLLKLDVAFPGEAPSRLSVAMRACRTADLARDLREHRLQGHEATAAEGILQLAAAMTSHDRHTRYHSERVRGYTRVIGEAMGVTRHELDKLAWSGLLHDVGKLAIDPAILNKPRRLDEDEMAIMRQHPVVGASMARPLMPWLGSWGLAIAHHHERWDGTGYPAGLSGRRISLGGRIVAVADAYEAMTAKRSYNTPRSLANARRELVESAGSQFDPTVVRALLAVPLSRLGRIAIPSAALGALPSMQELLGGWSEGVHLGPVAVRNAAAAVAGTAVVASGALSTTPSRSTPADLVQRPAGQTAPAEGEMVFASVERVVADLIPPAGTTPSVVRVQDETATSDESGEPAAPAIPLSRERPPAPAPPGGPDGAPGQDQADQDQDEAGQDEAGQDTPGAADQPAAAPPAQGAASQDGAPAGPPAPAADAIPDALDTAIPPADQAESADPPPAAAPPPAPAPAPAGPPPAPPAAAPARPPANPAAETVPQAVEDAIGAAPANPPPHPSAEQNQEH